MKPSYKDIYFKGILNEIDISDNISDLIKGAGISLPLNITIYRTNFYIPDYTFNLIKNHRLDELKTLLRKYKLKKIINKSEKDDNKILRFVEFFLSANSYITIIS